MTNHKCDVAKKIQPIVSYIRNTCTSCQKVEDIHMETKPFCVRCKNSEAIVRENTYFKTCRLKGSVAVFIKASSNEVVATKIKLGY